MKNYNEDRPIKGVIFDLDGVIIDSYMLQTMALNYSYNIIVGKDNPPYDNFFLRSGDSLLNIFTELHLPLSMIDIYNKFSEENIDKIQLINGIENLLYKIKKNKIKCGLCTGKDRKRTIQILNKFNILSYFDLVICSDDNIESKPSPQCLVNSMELLSTSKKNTIMIGDAPNDILCAQNAGIKSIGVTWGVSNRNTLLETGANYLVNDVDELEKLFDELDLF